MKRRTAIFAGAVIMGLIYGWVSGRSNQNPHYPELGWLIGEAVFQQDRLMGRIEFYPYRVLGAEHRRSPIIRDWEPHLVEPSDRPSGENK